MTTTTRPWAGGTLALGAILIVVGLLAVVGRWAGVDLGSVIGEQTWPFLVIVPGLGLAGLAFTRTPPDGVGFAIAGSIVTTVGAILLYQANTLMWSNWAYVWTLIPAAAGLGMGIYGFLTGMPELVAKGTRLFVIGGLMFMVGWWYFEAIFSTGSAPFDAGTWWPIALIVVGVVAVTRAVAIGRREGTEP